MEIDANSAWWNLESHETNTSLERGIAGSDIYQRVPSNTSVRSYVSAAKTLYLCGLETAK